MTTPMRGTSSVLGCPTDGTRAFGDSERPYRRRTGRSAPDMWHRPPFAPEVRDGWLYGRGAGDMKAGLVLNHYALLALRRPGVSAGCRCLSPVRRRRGMYGQRGARVFAARLSRRRSADSGPFSHRLTVAQVGVMWFQVKVTGHPVHVYHADAGSNAIESAFRMIQALRELEKDWNARKRWTMRTSIATTIPGRSSNVGKIHGGDWASSVPGMAHVRHARRRVAVDVAATGCAGREDLIRNAAARDPYLGNSPPTLLWEGFQAEPFVLTGHEEARAVLRTAPIDPCSANRWSTKRRPAPRTTAFLAYTRAFRRSCMDPSRRIFTASMNVSNSSRCAASRRATALFLADWCGLQTV